MARAPELNAEDVALQLRRATQHRQVVALGVDLQKADPPRQDAARYQVVEANGRHSEVAALAVPAVFGKVFEAVVILVQRTVAVQGQVQGSGSRGAADRFRADHQPRIAGETLA